MKKKNKILTSFMILISLTSIFLLSGINNSNVFGSTNNEPIASLAICSLDNEESLIISYEKGDEFAKWAFSHSYDFDPTADYIGTYEASMGEFYMEGSGSKTPFYHINFNSLETRSPSFSIDDTTSVTLLTETKKYLYLNCLSKYILTNNTNADPTNFIYEANDHLFSSKDHFVTSFNYGTNEPLIYYGGGGMTVTNPLELSYYLELDLKINSSFYNWNNLILQTWDTLSGWIQQNPYSISLNHPYYKVKLIDSDSSSIIYEDTIQQTFETTRTIDILDLKIKNNADELVNVSLFSNSSTVTSLHFEKESDYVSIDNNTYTVYNEENLQTNSSISFNNQTNNSEYYNVSSTLIEGENELMEASSIYISTIELEDDFKVAGGIHDWGTSNPPNDWVGTNLDSLTVESDYSGHDYHLEVVRAGTWGTAEMPYGGGASNSEWSAWFNLDSSSTQYLVLGLVDSIGSWSGACVYLINKNVYYWSSTSTWEDSGIDVISNTWYQVHCIWDKGGNQQIFLNGISIVDTNCINSQPTTYRIQIQNLDAYIDAWGMAEEGYIQDTNRFESGPYVEGDIDIEIPDLDLSQIKNFSLNFNFSSNNTYQSLNLSSYCFIHEDYNVINSSVNQGINFTFRLENYSVNYFAENLTLRLHINAANTTFFNLNMSYELIIFYYDRDPFTDLPSIGIAYEKRLFVNETNTILIDISKGYRNIDTIWIWDNITDVNETLGDSEGLYSKSFQFPTSIFYSIEVFVNDTSGNYRNITIDDIFVMKNHSYIITQNLRNKYIQYSNLEVAGVVQPTIGDVNISLYSPEGILLLTDLNLTSYYFNGSCGWYTINFTYNGSNSQLKTSLELVIELVPLNQSYETVYFSQEANFTSLIAPYSSRLTNITNGTWFVIVLDINNNELYNTSFDLWLQNEIAYTSPNTRECFISIANQRNDYLNWENYRLFVDGIPIYSNSFYQTIGVSINVSISTRFNKSITYMEYVVSRSSNYLPFTITQHSLKIFNQQLKFIHSNITFDPNYYVSDQYWSEWIAPNEVVEYLLTEDYYKVNLTEYETNTSTSYAYSLNSDDLLLVTSSNTLLNVLNNIENVNTTLGNQITNVEVNITNQNSEINNTIVNIEINLENTNSSLTNLLLNQETSINNIENNISTMFVYIENNFTTISNDINTSFTEINSSVYLINNSIYTSVQSVSASLVNVNNTIHGNLTLILSQNEYLTQIYQYTMFSDFLDWTNASRNVSYIEDQVRTTEFLNLYRNESLALQLKYESEIESLTLLSDETKELNLPKFGTEYRVKSLASGEYLTEWAPISNDTINLGFYEEPIRVSPEDIRLEIKDYLLIALFATITLAVIGILYVKTKANLSNKTISDKKKEPGVMDNSSLYLGRKKTSSGLINQKLKKQKKNLTILLVLISAILILFSLYFLR
jgi:hypothetical protein